MVRVSFATFCLSILVYFSLSRVCITWLHVVSHILCVLSGAKLCTDNSYCAISQCGSNITNNYTMMMVFCDCIFEFFDDNNQW